MKVKGAEIIAFWEDHRNWCGMSGIDGFFLDGYKDEYIADEISNGISKILIDPNLEYNLSEFGEIAPWYDGGRVTFEDAFFNWKANIPSDFRVNNKILKKLDDMKELLPFMGSKCESEVSRKYVEIAIGEILDSIILELSEGEEE